MAIGKKYNCVQLIAIKKSIQFKKKHCTGLFHLALWKEQTGFLFVSSLQLYLLFRSILSILGICGENTVVFLYSIVVFGGKYSGILGKIHGYLVLMWLCLLFLLLLLLLLSHLLFLQLLCLCCIWMIWVHFYIRKQGV